MWSFDCGWKGLQKVLSNSLQRDLMNAVILDVVWNFGQNELLSLFEEGLLGLMFGLDELVYRLEVCWTNLSNLFVQPFHIVLKFLNRLIDKLVVNSKHVSNLLWLELGFKVKSDTLESLHFLFGLSFLKTIARYFSFKFFHHLLGLSYEFTLL